MDQQKRDERGRDNAGQSLEVRIILAEGELKFLPAEARYLGQLLKVVDADGKFGGSG